MSGCRSVLFPVKGKDGYNIDGRAYGRLLFDTNIVFGKIGYLIRLGKTYPNQLVSRMEDIRKACKRAENKE